MTGDIWRQYRERLRAFRPVTNYDRYICDVQRTVAIDAVIEMRTLDDDAADCVLWELEWFE